MMSVEESLTVRAQQRELWPVCGRCRQWLQSKGFQPRMLHTLFTVKMHFHHRGWLNQP